MGYQYHISYVQAIGDFRVFVQGSIPILPFDGVTQLLLATQILLSLVIGGRRSEIL
jgi:hypothetical protein